MEDTITKVESGTITFEYEKATIKALCSVHEDGCVEHDLISVENAGQLKSAEVEIKGNEHELCMECHAYIIRPAMVTNLIDHCMDEIEECSNPECSNKALPL